jgi:hypothetical protein
MTCGRRRKTRNEMTIVIPLMRVCGEARMNTLQREFNQRQCCVTDDPLLCNYLGNRNDQEMSREDEENVRKSSKPTKVRIQTYFCNIKQLISVGATAAQSHNNAGKHVAL